MAIVALFFNVYLARKLPLIEGILVVIHILGFFATLVTLWVLAPTAKPSVVFVSVTVCVYPRVASSLTTSSIADLGNFSLLQTTFNDGGNWGSLGGSALIGIVSSLNPLMGADAAVHMSEEVKDAGRSVPRFAASIPHIRPDHKTIILTNIHSPEPS